MFEELKTAARKAGSDRTLRNLLLDCKRLLSERGAANSVTIARELVAHFSALPEAQQGVFFERLALDFNLDAQVYVAEPTARHMVDLTHKAESPRQEQFRRINRLPGGTSSIVAMRRAMLACGGIPVDLLELQEAGVEPTRQQVQQIGLERLQLGLLGQPGSNN